MQSSIVQVAWRWSQFPPKKKLLGRLKMDVQDLDLIELNEAFVSQVPACYMEMPELAGREVDPNGGAIALYQPFGYTGARLAVMLIHEMKERNVNHGRVTMRIGLGGPGINVYYINR